ncbi:MAG: class I SAM-dependent methyltransferase, partial [Chloroflexus sp.]
RVMKRLYAHLLSGGILVASLMTLWKEGESLESEWEQTAVRKADGVTFRRVVRSWFNPISECESTEDLYQKMIDEKVVIEELYKRSPATRSYSQSQVKDLFEKAGFQNVQLFSGFTFDMIKPEDRLFVVMEQKLSPA